MYDTILFDLDHTLLDSIASEREAYAHTASRAGIDDPDRHFATYVEINQAMWREVEAGHLQPTDIRVRRFETFVERLGIDADPQAMAEDFVWGLGAFGDLYPGARTVLATLAGRASLGLVTNGLSDVQRSRLSRLGIGDYFDSVVISGEVGVTKPRPDIFDIAFDQLGSPSKDGTVMVGDSLTSDIAGGHGYGIATCWYNPSGNRSEHPVTPTHVVQTLAAIPPLLAP